jgi:hypothetical protein
MFTSAFRRFAAVLGCTALLAAAAAPAATASAGAIYKACRTGGSLSGFSKSDLQSALGGVPADAEEYYACSALINAAIIDKATQNIPGGHGSGVKGTKERLKKATVNDLTTPAERRRLRERVARQTNINSGRPFGAGDPAIRAGAGQTLASSAAPGSPTALLIGMIGLLVLLGADLAGRLKRAPRTQQSAPDPIKRDDD